MPTAHLRASPALCSGSLPLCLLPSCRHDRRHEAQLPTHARQHGSGGSAAAHLVQSLPALGRCRSRRAGGTLRCRSICPGMAPAPRLLAMRQPRDGLRRRPTTHRRARLLARAARSSPPPPLPGRRGALGRAPHQRNHRRHQGTTNSAIRSSARLRSASARRFVMVSTAVSSSSSA